MAYDLSVPNPGPIPFPEDIDATRIRRIHVLGVAGTGMGSFAGLLQKAGYEVTGSDENIYPPMSEKLPEWGIHVMPGFKPENLDAARPDFVIVGNVIRKVNPEATAMRERGLRHASFPAALGKLFLETRRAVVVAGTHGKTTTTSLLAHLLAAAGRDPSFLVGGVPKNFPESFHVGSGSEFALEGDEYDTAYFDKGPKFLHYRPKLVQFNGAEFDHADIYRDMDHYESAFTRLFALVPPDGYIAACATFQNTAKLIAGVRAAVETYSARVPADVVACDITMGPDGSRFTVKKRGELVGSFFLPMHGLHNVENATGAIAIALRLGVPPDAIRAGLATFAGVRRRQELVTDAGGVTLVDDFAHHPTAVIETIAAIRARFPGRRIWALFEPRSNTASRSIHQHAYEEAFQGAAEVVLSLPKKIDGLAPGEALDVAALAAAMAKHGQRARAFGSVDDILKTVLDEAQSGDVLLVMSNGAFGGLVSRLKARLEARATNQGNAPHGTA
jgi:UDP-N-acetylmuramate: L-alanyl-gamma-D-glutamyl-meso-diaminopimelate ligase